ncbi:MAG: DUF2232 domain-containing protein [Clostridia bacterium]|nr:DUF2232 domain-containing protein [Clostridia bacterium]
MKPHYFKFYFLNTLLTIALCGAYCFLGGILNIVIGIMIAALLGTVMHREHIVLGVTNTLLILVVLTIFLGPLQALISGVPMILLGLTLALGTRVKMNMYYMILLCTVLYLLDLLVGLKLAGGDVTFSSMMLDSGSQMREMMQMYYPEPEYQALIEQVISATVDTMIMLAPAIFTIICTMLSYALISVYKKIQMVQKTDMSFLIPFGKLRAEKQFAILYLVLFVVITFAKEGLFVDAAANVLLILSFLFFALGLSVFNYKLKQGGTGSTMRKLLTAALICFSTMFFMIPFFALVLCGLTDAFFDYRGLSPKETQENNNRQNRL